MKNKILFIDRDGTIIKDPPPFHRPGQFTGVDFYPFVFEYLGRIARELDYLFVMITNQDGLGSDIFPNEAFWPPHHFIMKTFEDQGICFDDVFIDTTFPHENKSTRKPGTGLLKKYLNDPKYDIENSFVIGDRITDVLLAQNIGCKAIFINNNTYLGAHEVSETIEDLQPVIELDTTSWKDIYEFLKSKS